MLNNYCNAHATCSKDVQPLACILFSYMYIMITALPITVASYCILSGLQPTSACSIHFCCDCRQTMPSMLTLTS